MSFLNCTEFRARLETAIEERRLGADTLDADQALHQHAANCRSCRRELQRELLVAEAVESWNAETPSVDLVASVMAGLKSAATAGAGDAPLEDRSLGNGAIPQDRSHNASLVPACQSHPYQASSSAGGGTTGALRGRGMLAVVAAVLCGAAAVWLAVPRGGDSLPVATDNVPGQTTQDAGPESIAAESPLPSAGDSAVTEQVALGGALEDAGTAWAALAREAAGAVSGTRMLLPRQAVPTLAEFDPPAVNARPEWAAGWNQDLEPLREQVDQAFGFLLDVLPDSAPAAG